MDCNQIWADANLHRSQFESRWSLQFLFCKMVEKNEK